MEYPPSRLLITTSARRAQRRAKERLREAVQWPVEHAEVYEHVTLEPASGDEAQSDELKEAVQKIVRTA